MEKWLVAYYFIDNMECEHSEVTALFFCSAQNGEWKCTICKRNETYRRQWNVCFDEINQHALVVHYLRVKGDAILSYQCMNIKWKFYGIIFSRPIHNSKNIQSAAAAAADSVIVYISSLKFLKRECSNDTHANESVPIGLYLRISRC